MDKQAQQTNNSATPPRMFDLETFKKASQSMIATNENSYRESYLNWEQVKPVREYTVQEVKDIIRSGSVDGQRELSRNYYNANGFYKQIITHYATLLRYYGILIPSPALGKSLQDKPIAKRYYNAVEFVDKMHLQSLCQRIAHKVLVDGTYYGAIQTMDKTTFTLMDLPAKYCRSKFQNEYGDLIVEFDVRFFNSITDKKNQQAALSTYPKVISSYYRKWSKNSSTLSPWLFLPSDVGVAFNLFDARPYFLSIIPATIQYDTAVENELEREIEEIKKMVVQKIPHLNDGTLLFEPQEVAEMHEGAVKMLRTSNPKTSVFTTYGDVSVEGLKGSDAITNNTLKNMLQNTYANAGVSGEIFAATGSSSLGTSLEYDTALMMVLGNKIGIFISNILNLLYSNGAIRFKYVILPISCHNDKDYMNNYFKLASSGYSCILPAIAQGLTQHDLMNIKTLENDVLKLQEVLIPLSSAYTQSNNGDSVEGGKGNDESEAPTEEGGRPPKGDLEKTEKTIKNKESKDKTGG